VKKFKGEDIRRFIRETYHSDQIVLCSVGNIDFKRFIHLAQKYFSRVPSNLRKENRKPFTTYVPQQKTEERKIFQTHCIIGAPGYSIEHEKRFILAFLNNILGGPVLNSRLSIALREKNGLTYHIESNYIPYSDTGLMSVYFGTDGDLLEKALALVMKELARVRNVKIGKVPLQTAKKQLIGQVSIAQESKQNLMLSMGKSFLMMDRYLSLGEIIRIIESITAEELMEAANEILAPEMLSQLIFKSSKQTYDDTRMGTVCRRAYHPEPSILAN